MQIIASSRTSSQRRVSNETSSGPGPRIDKQGRPMMSARRSGTSSSRTITRANITVSQSPTSPSPGSRPPLASVNSQHGDGLTEAGAYARAMTSSIPRSGSTPSKNPSFPASDEYDVQRNKQDRPLPRPPGPSVSFSPPPFQPEESHRRNQADQVQVHASRSAAGPTAQAQAHGRSSTQTPQPLQQRRESYTIPSSSNTRRVSSEKVTDNSGSAGYNTPPEIPPSIARLSRDIVHVQQADKAHHLPESRNRSTTGLILQRPFGRPPLDFLLAHPAIQSSLLSVIGINTFLSLSGSSEDVRRQFTGESVGRWVLDEWTVRPPDQAGNRWPNLTVWEGFCTSRPACTYTSIADG
jgi:hypothetical protein